jgi:hypothetical protein
LFSTAIAAKARQSNYLVEFLPNIHRALQSTGQAKARSLHELPSVSPIPISPQQADS